jgi:hypothetical protein
MRMVQSSLRKANSPIGDAFLCIPFFILVMR